MPFHTWSIGKCLVLISFISFSVSADNGITWSIKIHDVVQTFSKALGRLKATVTGNHNVNHREHNVSPQDLILSQFHPYENFNNYWLVTSENNFNIILPGTPQFPERSPDKESSKQTFNIRLFSPPYVLRVSSNHSTAKCRNNTGWWYKFILSNFLNYLVSPCLYYLNIVFRVFSLFFRPRGISSFISTLNHG
jgi:hypothetical protein